MKRGNRELQTVSHGGSLSLIGDHAEHVAGFEYLLNRHRNGLHRHGFDRLKPTFAHLLTAASLVEIHNQVRLFSLKVGRRIIESQVPVLTDPDKGCINLVLGD